ncbi:TetR/AcrR family transcriptional regulator [Ottowia thiooxydans]|uniref:TetR/AcrR family transcriptional regulator n=1 Tax=Ottowia thiooxydans TaxID=219182 RepID=UPI00041C1D47|nr:TetR/AcrR family transcriptional regulator [Ottowia thiooxydans]
MAAALRVFATRGFEAATLKEITLTSQTNVAAIHYHFGSKEVLIQEVLASVANPINSLRLELLNSVPEGPERTLVHVVRSLVAPPIQLSLDSTGDARLLTRLLLQARALPSEFTSTTIFAQYDATAQHFVRALMAATPGLSQQDAYWRYAFAIGAMHYIVSESDAGHHRLQRISGGVCDTSDPDAILSQLVAFVVAGFQASTPSPVEPNAQGHRVEPLHLL